jgi:hypothetical protein
MSMGLVKYTCAKAKRKKWSTLVWTTFHVNSGGIWLVTQGLTIVTWYNGFLTQQTILERDNFTYKPTY